MLDRLREREEMGKPIRVGLIGAGAMGTGIAWQISRTPGMELVFIGDIDVDAAREAAHLSGHETRLVEDASGEPEPREPLEVFVTGDPLSLIEGSGGRTIDVLVESSNTVGPAARYCFAAIDRGLDVVLMNAEVDLALGQLMQHRAREKGVVVSSDAGDQHGVLRRMIDEIEMWGFEIVQAGNIKGFLDRYATPESIAAEAAVRSLNPIQCCAYTDGTKLCIEMACLANSVGLEPDIPGMRGPRASSVTEVLELFDFDAQRGGRGRIDYILGAEPGGGVYVVGRCEEPLQARYLSYYKMGDGPHYLFYRPYHLCHLETPRAIAAAVLDRRALMAPEAGRLTDVYAYAKRDLQAGETIEHAIGGDAFYGLVETCSAADEEGKVPLAILEPENGARAVLKSAIPKDAALSVDSIQLPDTYLCERFEEQSLLTASDLNDHGG